MQQIIEPGKRFLLSAMLTTALLHAPMLQAQGVSGAPRGDHDELLLPDFTPASGLYLSEAPEFHPDVFETQSLPQGDPRQGDPKRLEELRQRIRELKHRKLQDALGLDDAASKAFFESYRPAERDIEQLVHERNAALRELYRASRSDGRASGDAELESKMTEIRRLNAKIEQRWIELDAKLKPVISPKQRGQLLMFEKRFNERLRKELRDRRMDRNPEFRRRVEDWQKFRERRGGAPDDRGGPPRRPDGPPPGKEGNARGR